MDNIDYFIFGLCDYDTWRGCAETENSVVIAILLLLGLAIWYLRLVGIGRFVSIIAAEIGFGS